MFASGKGGGERKKKIRDFSSLLILSCGKKKEKTTFSLCAQKESIYYQA